MGTHDSSPIMHLDTGRVLGNYLRKSDTLVDQMASAESTIDLIKALQVVGAVRQNLDPEVTAHLLEMLSYGQLTIADFKLSDQIPPFSVVLEALADLLDRWLLPDDGDNSDAGKEVIRQVATETKGRIKQTRLSHGEARDTKEVV